MLSVLFECDGAQIGVAQIYLALDHVVPGRAIGILEVRHKGAGAAVERIDDHFPISRTGDFDTTILDIGRHWRDYPTAIAYMLGCGQKVGQRSTIELFLTYSPCCQQGLTGRFKLGGELYKKRQGIGRKYSGKCGRYASADRETARQIWGVDHVFSCGREEMPPRKLEEQKYNYANKAVRSAFAWINIVLRY